LAAPDVDAMGIGEFGGSPGRTRGGAHEDRAVLGPTRLLALGAIVLVGVLYWKPIHSYEHTSAVLGRREAEVSRLQAQQRQLKDRIAAVGTGQDLIREARRLGFVKPGEQLFIVRGIAAWRAGKKK
jgi:cell division protein FtsB